MSTPTQVEKPIFSAPADEKETIHREQTASSHDKGDLVWCTIYRGKKTADMNI